MQESVIKISGFIDPASARRLRAFAESTYAAIDKNIDRIENQGMADNFKTWAGVWLKPLPEFLRSNAPELLPAFSALSKKIASSASLALETRFDRWFNPQWAPLLERSFFRRHENALRHVPWHIDADAAAVAGIAKESVNVWLPLEDVGETAPSLEFILGSNAIMRELPLLDAHRARTDEWVKENTSNRRWTPSACLGDALIFDQYTLHRTQQMPARARRLSCEFRFRRSTS